MKKFWTVLALALVTTATAAAQTQTDTTVQSETDNVIEYTPVNCVTPDELPVFQMNVSEPGDLRAYFRLVNTPDWCWVQGNNVGPLSTVVFPKFHPGEEVEYFFVLLDKKHVIGKSPVVYRVKAADRCETLVARHSFNFVVDCAHEVSGSASSIIAGNSFRGPKPTEEYPRHISPDTPENP